MEKCPPPYSPQYAAATAPPIDQAPMLQRPAAINAAFPQTSPSATTNQFNQNYFGPSTSSIPLQPTNPVAQVAPPPQVPAVAVPLRCMAGNVEIATGTSSNLESIGSWRSQYIEVREGMLYMSPTASNRTQPVTNRSLQNQFISMPEKKIVAIEDNLSCLAIKSSTEVKAHKWFMTLSQYCFVAPTMEGYCHKLSNRKKVMEERFLRLSSEGVLSWFRSHNEDSERRGSIQVRGHTCGVDTSDPTKINVQVLPRTYQFQFPTAREAQLWLAALQWHYGRKSLRKAQVRLRNQAK